MSSELPVMPERPPSQEPASPGGRVPIAAWLAVALLLGANMVLLGTLSGLWLQNFPPLLGAALGALGVLLLVAVLPIGALRVGLGRLAAGGAKIHVGRIGGALLVCWNVALAAGALQLSSEPLGEAFALRGTWIFDGLTGRGPFGAHAQGVVEDLVLKALEDPSPEVLVDSLSHESAQAVAVWWIRVLDSGRTLENGRDPGYVLLDDLMARHGIDLAAVAAGDASSLPSDGRGLLRDVARLIPIAQPREGWGWGPLVDLAVSSPEAQREAITITPRSRHRLDLDVSGQAWTAVYEEGWRLQLTDLETQLADVARRVDALPSSVGAADDAAVREVLTRAATGRVAVMAGVAPQSWPSSLTQAAAVAQGERLRAWCVAVGGQHIVSAQASLSSRWGVPAEGPAKEETLRSLRLKGRSYLADVVTMCGPAFAARQRSDAGLGLGETRRRRWAEVDGRRVAQAALIDWSGTHPMVAVEGGVVSVLLEDGAWRVAWLD